MLKWLWLSVVVIVLDQITKIAAEAHLVLHQPVPVVPSFNLTLRYNEGAAFSFLHDQGGWQRYFFVVIALVVTTVLTLWMRRLESGQKILAAALALVIGGALGNVIDRIIYGHVIDFIEVFYDQWYWPAFNVADSAIFVGVGLLLLDAWQEKRGGES